MDWLRGEAIAGIPKWMLAAGLLLLLITIRRLRATRTATPGPDGGVVAPIPMKTYRTVAHRRAA